MPTASPGRRRPAISARLGLIPGLRFFCDFLVSGRHLVPGTYASTITGCAVKLVSIPGRWRQSQGATPRELPSFPPAVAAHPRAAAHHRPAGGGFGGSEGCMRAGVVPARPFARLLGPLFNTALPSARPVQGSAMARLSHSHRPHAAVSQPKRGACSRRHVPLYPGVPHPSPTQAHPTTPWRYTRDLVHHQAEIPQPWYFSATAPGGPPQTFRTHPSPSRPKGEQFLGLVK